jgi:hypothetical protein
MVVKACVEVGATVNSFLCMKHTERGIGRSGRMDQPRVGVDGRRECGFLEYQGGKEEPAWLLEGPRGARTLEQNFL